MPVLPDALGTLYGATFFVVAVDAPLADELCAPEQRSAFEAYREQARKLTDIDIPSHAIAHVFYPAGNVNGGGIWGPGGASLDPTNDHVFVATS